MTPNTYRPRPNYNPEAVQAFMTIARGVRHRDRAVKEAMRRHPAGTQLAAGVRVLSGPGPIPRDTPPLLNADGTRSEPLPTTYPED